MTLPQLSPLQEQLLVVRAQEGDAEAFGVLVTAYERRLLFFIRRFCPDADLALDLLQDVWLTAFRKLRDLRSPAAWRVWLYQLSHDRAVTQVRRDRRQVEVMVEMAVTDEVLDVHEFERVEVAALVRALLDKLPELQRTVLVLRFLEDMSLDDLAATLRIPVGTVKSRLYHAREALRQSLKENGDDLV